MNVGEISITLDRPGVFDPLVQVLETIRRQQPIGDSWHHSLAALLNILIIDANQGHAQMVASVVTSMGYRPLLAPTALFAFRSFLQERFTAMAVIVGQEDSSDHFFRQRLLQQMYQNQRREISVIRLHFPMGHELPSHGTSFVPLAKTSTLPRIPTTPLPESLPAIPKPPVTSATARPSSVKKDSFNPQTPIPEVYNRTPSGPLPEIAAITQPLINDLPVERKAVEKIPLEGQSIGRYQLKRKLGGGSTGDVYLTYDRLREQDFALKIIRTNTMYYQPTIEAQAQKPSFQREVDLVTSLNHPHILSLLNCGEAYITGYPFIYKVMPLCQEQSLADWFQQNPSQKALPVQEVVQVIWQLADALQAAHEHGVVYQNVKLTNMLIADQSQSTGHFHILLSDFAVARDNVSVAQIGSAAAYIAPEQWNGLSVPASDQYALAALAYELLTGRPPFQGSSMHIMKRLHLTMAAQSPHTFNPALPASISHVFQQALAKRPEDRFSSIAIFAQTLAAILRVNLDVLTLHFL